ncbi:MAG: acetate/propionate family kinase [Dermatophilaceae bacterium]
MTGPVTGPVLVLNVGSTSVRHHLIEAATGTTLASGYTPGLGGAVIEDAVRQVIGAAVHQESARGQAPVAVVHRVVHGGTAFRRPTVIDDAVVQRLGGLVHLAPQHLPGCLAAIDAARHAIPDVPQVAVFDTAFHASLPAYASSYAVPAQWRTDFGVRRYGFHGTSFAYSTRRAAELLDRPVSQVNLVLLHLGGGASACAVRDGRSVDTSMGLTPTEGLVMGTRSGDVDPLLGPYLVDVAGIDIAEFGQALSETSGLLGLAGTASFEELLNQRRGGDPDAVLAFDIAAYRIRKYVGSYAVALGRVDALVFTGAVGEHSHELRQAVVGGLGSLGVELDDEVNRRGAAPERRVSAPGSRFAVYVIPAAEELELVRACVTALA